jgi:hypothetical protein
MDDHSDSARVGKGWRAARCFARDAMSIAIGNIWFSLFGSAC